jgi:3-dehydroquinate synthetase
MPTSQQSARTQPRRIAFVGGLERLEREILSFGDSLGLEVEMHNGHTWGGGTARLVGLVQRADLVIIVTGTNSHNAVQIARREAAKAGARVRLLSFLGAGTARALLTEIAQQAAA